METIIYINAYAAVGILVVWFVLGVLALFAWHFGKLVWRRDTRTPQPTQPSPASQGDALDAARYRWLRQHSLAAGQGSIRVELDDRANGHFSRSIFLAELDAAIDAARAARAPAYSVLEDAARESEYRRGYRHGYEQRDAEVRGALV